MTTRVQVEIFEGPLDLLLHLIKKNEVSISDIPIATITEQYLATLEVMQAFNLDVACRLIPAVIICGQSHGAETNFRLPCQLRLLQIRHSDHIGAPTPIEMGLRPG